KPPTPAILGPGHTLGVVGGGQLGRMFAAAARRLGYRIQILDPVPQAPAAQLADGQTIAAYDDVAAARRFAELVDVVTFEFENVPAETLQAIEEIRPVRPAPKVLHVCRHRSREKDYLSRHGFPVAPYRVVRSSDDVQHAAEELGLPVILKTADFGYDGKGQARLEHGDEAAAAWTALGRPVGVVEAFVPFDREVSVIVAADGRGNLRSFGPVENTHSRHILDVSVAPASCPPEMAQRAVAMAEAIAATLGVVGLLTVEMFVVGDQLIVNELAPRPHNSGHYTIDACSTSQFEQHLRAICGLPLGETRQLQPAAMANLLGDLWSRGEPNWAAALAVPGVRLHLYGKAEPRPGRKMGHLTALADTVEEARALVLKARAALVASP
ncbi:MAG: 5-(carboxyamino)imidazole ribonucleotide synthase, partial [Gemmataceae bacterium]|nr:5-(carboxyamino)imidazole ribonucleotide synthase [Gemmataceae bacterium]